MAEVKRSRSINQRWLIILGTGDFLVLVLITLAGFATHGTLGTTGTRFFTTLVPLILAWLAVAPLMGCYKFELVLRPSQLWKPFWAMVVASPLAALLRSAMLGGAPILPLFVIILGGIAAIAILIWRLIFQYTYAWVTRRNG